MRRGKGECSDDTMEREILPLLLVDHADACIIMMIMVIMTMKWCKGKKMDPLLLSLSPSSRCLDACLPIFPDTGYILTSSDVYLSSARSLK